MNPFDKALQVAFTPDCHHRVSFANKRPKRVKSMRRNVIKHIRGISYRLQPVRSLLTRKLDALAPACSINIPLIEFLIKELDYPDASLPRDLTYGIHISGVIEPTNTLVARETLASVNMTSIRTNLREREGRRNN